MSINETIPPLRDLPSGRLDTRTEHLVAEIRRGQRRPPSLRHFVTPRRRTVALAAVLGALAVGTAVAATTTWLTGEPAPKSVVEDFGSYTPQLGFNPEPGRAVLVARDGEFSLYATTNKQGSYCLLASAPWKRPTKGGEGGTCIPPTQAKAPLIAGLVGARSSPNSTEWIYLIAGRTTDREARAIRFAAPTGDLITRPIGSSGFFIVAVRAGDSACAHGDWTPTFTPLDADGAERETESLTIRIASARAPGVCVFGTPHS